MELVRVAVKDELSAEAAQAGARQGSRSDGSALDKDVVIVVVVEDGTGCRSRARGSLGTLNDAQFIVEIDKGSLLLLSRTRARSGLLSALGRDVVGAGDPGGSVEDLRDLVFGFVLVLLLLGNIDGTALDGRHIRATLGRNVGATSRNVGPPRGNRALLLFFLLQLILGVLLARDALVARLVAEFALDTVGIDVAVLAADDAVDAASLLLERSCG